MVKNEIKEVREYCWGSVVTFSENGKPHRLVTAKASYLCGSFMFMVAISFIIGFLVGRIS